jgi:hypothetical protein
MCESQKLKIYLKNNIKLKLKISKVTMFKSIQFYTYNVPALYFI